MRRVTEAFRQQIASRMLGNTYCRGVKLSYYHRLQLTVRLLGNNRRSEKPHSTETKHRISAGLKRAIQEGRHTSGARTLLEFRLRVASGEVPNPWTKEARNREMMRLHLGGRTFLQIAKTFDIDPSQARKTILRDMKRAGVMKQTARQRNVAIVAFLRETPDVEEAAEIFGVTKSVAYNLGHRHGLPVSVRGKRR